MYKMNLQLFADAEKPIDGTSIVYLYRLLKDAATSAADGLAFTTENGTSESKDADSIVTKDGTIRNPKAMETEITATSYLSSDSAMIKKFRQAMRDNDVIEIWEINKAAKGTLINADKYEATYYQGYLTSYENTSTAEDKVEISLTFAINGEGVDGYATLSADQEAVVKYLFKDTTSTGA